MKNFKMQDEVRLLGEEIVEGIDELGCLLMGDFGAYWYGSQLSIHEARRVMGQSSTRPRRRSRHRCWRVPCG